MFVMDNSLLIQKQIKDNAEDLQNYVWNLKLWEEEMKRKDRQLSNEPTEEVLPPVRRSKLTTKSPAKKQEKNESTKKKLKSYDYSSWDKFDVEKACEEIDNEDNKDNEETHEETTAEEEKYLKEKALYEKELGNKHVKASKWDEAVECYTKAIQAFPKDPVFFANRALCHLKKKRYEMVESDCTASLKLDPTYVKAMLRRAAAREALGRIEDARYDLHNALKLEPNNSQALKDLERLKETSKKNKITITNHRETSKINTEESSSQTAKSTSFSQSSLEDKKTKACNPQESISEPDWEPCMNTIQPIDKPPHLRSKKSLKRIDIHDIGPNYPQHVCARKTQKSVIPSTISQNAEPLAATSRDEKVAAPTGCVGKPRSVLTVTTPVTNVPPPPTTSVQFHTAWNSLKSRPDLRYRYLKQIPGESLPDIFKESLESNVFSSILETMVSEFLTRCEPVFSYLQGLSRVKRFSTLALFMTSHDKSNLIKLFDYCSKNEDCSFEDLSLLQRNYELKY